MSPTLVSGDNHHHHHIFAKDFATTTTTSPLSLPRPKISLQRTLPLTMTTTAIITINTIKHLLNNMCVYLLIAFCFIERPNVRKTFSNGLCSNRWEELEVVCKGVVGKEGKDGWLLTPKYPSKWSGLVKVNLNRFLHRALPTNPQGRRPQHCVIHCNTCDSHCNTFCETQDCVQLGVYL